MMCNVTFFYKAIINQIYFTSLALTLLYLFHFSLEFLKINIFIFIGFYYISISNLN